MFTHSFNSHSANHLKHHNISRNSIPDELENAINEHRFFITREGIVLVVLYSMLSAAAAAYSEWLLRVSHVEEAKGHGAFATPANARVRENKNDSTNKQNTPNHSKHLVDLRNRTLLNSPSGTTPLPLSSTISPLPIVILLPHEESPAVAVDPNNNAAATPRSRKQRQQRQLRNRIQTANESLPTKMVRIYFWGILFSIFHCVIEIAYQHEVYGTNSSLLDGFNLYTWILVLNQAAMGLVLTAIIHQMGAISKLFLLSVAMILTSIVTIFAFHLIPNFLFCLSFAMIIGSILLYNHEEFFKDELSSQIEMTPIKKSMAKVANKLYAYMFAATVLFVLGGGVAASLSIHEKFQNIPGT